MEQLSQALNHGVLPMLSAASDCQMAKKTFTVATRIDNSVPNPFLSVISHKYP